MLTKIERLLDHIYSEEFKRIIFSSVERGNLLDKMFQPKCVVVSMVF